MYVPDLPRFQRRKEVGDFNSAAFVADQLLQIAFDEAHRPGEVCAPLPAEREVVPQPTSP